MDPDTKQLARTMFRLKIYESNGQAFEDLFSKVMESKNPNFKRVKPQGSLGDRKNDGYDQIQGKYYQAYGPEDLKNNVADAMAKLEDDFSGLIAYWDSISKVREYYFVLNDRFKGTYPGIEKKLSLIKEKHRNDGLEVCTTLLTKEIEDTFLSLTDDNIIWIVGLIPDPSNIRTLDYSILSEIISHVMKYQGEYMAPGRLIVPDYYEKISFNRLSDIVKDLLKGANYVHGAIDDYFKYNSDYAKQALRDKMNEIYLESKSKFSETELENNDVIFFDILDKVSPDSDLSTKNASLVVISYFFESCDIFEDPTTL